MQASRFVLQVVTLKRSGKPEAWNPDQRALLRTAVSGWRELTSNRELAHQAQQEHRTPVVSDCGLHESRISTSQQHLKQPARRGRSEQPMDEGGQDLYPLEDLRDWAAQVKLQQYA